MDLLISILIKQSKESWNCMIKEKLCLRNERKHWYVWNKTNDYVVDVHFFYPTFKHVKNPNKQNMRNRLS